jgi:myo-inositol-1(or 4)-monophosphatase
MKSELETAKTAASEAGKIAMKYLGEEKEISYKGEVNLVTKADIEAENKIVQIIKDKFPNDSFILEESDNIKGKKHTWIIDPIDGTTSFAHNYPMFSISIALYKDNNPVLGVVYIPYLKEMFHAINEKGAYLNDKQIAVSKTSELKKSLIATGFPYERKTGFDNMNYLRKVIRDVQGIRRSGSAALDICYVACGRLDGYWEAGLKIMDTAAALVIVKEAGGKFTNLKGNFIKEDYSEIIASNSSIHEKLIKKLGE